MTVMDMIVDGEAQPSDTMVPGSQLCPQCQHTMEPIVDFRRPREHGPTDINRALVELVCKFKFLGVTITEDLRWSTHTNSEVRKAQVFGCSTDSILLYHLVQKLHHRLTQRGKLSASGEVSFPSFQEKHELGCSAESNTSLKTLTTQTTTCSRPVRTPSLGNTINVSPVTQAGSKTVIFHPLSGC